MLSEFRHIIDNELRAAELRIMIRLEPLLEEKRGNESGGTFEETAHLYIPDLE